ncbi:cytochrome c oxidase assembly protein COX11, mitochondrial [Plodia interpunctella]|uniref:cytochrome c oxidase assembly protein COX11, mitochondrial n=1 Tax=Plodia interpunctella TaxID=58824 RepID=UPI00236798B1|nr:cytochrome c oxidase assembly protein COX11, mitochondrial [Plodia interpunctella]
MSRLLWSSRCFSNTYKSSIFINSPPFLAPTKALRNVVLIRNAHDQKKNIRSTLNYVIALGVMTVGLSYAAVPLYRIFCQAYSYGGTTSQAEGDTVSKMTAVKDRPIKIRFNADVASSMQWNFKPQQLDITVVPGETALAFYTARNPTNNPVTGISTYNVVPFEAGQYFNKIQCFCFEEQQLNPHEQVDMPVFFYIDPEFMEDPKMEFVDEIVLSYTFFEAKKGMKLPVPSYVK